MEKSRYEARVEDHEWMHRASQAAFWLGVAIAAFMIWLESAWAVAFPLIGVCIASHYSIYWAALAGFGRGSLSATKHGLTKEDIERLG